MNRVGSGLIGAGLAAAGILGYQATVAPPIGQVTAVGLVAEAFADTSGMYHVPGGGFTSIFWSTSRQDSFMLSAVPTKYMVGLEYVAQRESEFWRLMACNLRPCQYITAKRDTVELQVNADVTMTQYIDNPDTFQISAVMPVPHAPHRMRVYFEDGHKSRQLTRYVWYRVEEVQ